MEIQKLIDKFQEIKTIVEDLPELDNPSDEDMMQRIYNICENTIMDWKIEKRLNDEKKS